ncbi:hypothetical protein Trydic_g5954 [Trypoxylus dichotomus]
MVGQRRLSIKGVTPLFFVIFAFVWWSVEARTKTEKFSHAPATLKFIHVVFRHGDRTQEGSYPTDPYQNNTFYPIGMGQLTNPGKIREYNIGRYLRKTYTGLIPEIYTPDVLRAISSPVPRCRASLQLVLAGLFPPIGPLKWNDNLNWNPIPYDYNPQAQDLLFWAFSNCPNYFTLMSEYRQSQAYRDVYAPHNEVLRYLMEKSGLTPSPYGVALMLYSTLRSQQDWGLTLPKWTETVWPEPITQITKLDWQQLFPTSETRAVGAGFLMSRIINETRLVLNRNRTVNGLRVSLYSGHDLNIAAILSWLGTPDIHVPQYGSFIIFEIHEIFRIPFIRIVHQNYEPGGPQVVEIPNCGFYCPFATFVELYRVYTNRADICYG